MNYKIPEILNNYKIEILIDKFSASSNSHNNNLNKPMNSNSNLSNINSNSNNFNSSNRNLNHFLKKSPKNNILNTNNKSSFQAVSNSLGATKLQIKAVENDNVYNHNNLFASNASNNMINNNSSNTNINKHNDEEINKFSFLPEKNYDILSAIVSLLPSYIKQFSNFMQVNDPATISYLKNNSIENILNGLDVELSERFMKILTPIQRLIFITIFKIELLSLGVKKFFKDHIMYDRIDYNKFNINCLGDVLNIKNLDAISHNFTVVFHQNIFHPKKLIYELYQQQLNCSFHSFSLGSNNISSLFKELSEIKPSNNPYRVYLLENLHLLDESNMDSLLKYTYELSLVNNHAVKRPGNCISNTSFNNIKHGNSSNNNTNNSTNSNTTHVKSFFIFFYESEFTTFSTDTTYMKNFFKEIFFYNRVYIDGMPNIKEIIEVDYRYLLQYKFNTSTTKESYQPQLQYNINNCIFLQYQNLKDKYSLSFKKLLSSSFLSYNFFFAKAIQFLRQFNFHLEHMNYQKRDIPYSNWTSVIMLIHLFEFCLEVILPIIENEKIRHYVDKNLLIVNINSIIHKFLTVDNEFSRNYSKSIVEDLFSFVMNRMEDKRINVYMTSNVRMMGSGFPNINNNSLLSKKIISKVRYSFPSRVKDYTEKELYEGILQYMPLFDHPLVLGFNRNLVIKYLYEDSQITLNEIQKILPYCFNKEEPYFNEVNRKNSSTNDTNNINNSYTFKFVKILTTHCEKREIMSYCKTGKKLVRKKENKEVRIDLKYDIKAMLSSSNIAIGGISVIIGEEDNPNMLNVNNTVKSQDTIEKDNSENKNIEDKEKNKNQNKNKNKNINHNRNFLNTANNNNNNLIMQHSKLNKSIESEHSNQSLIRNFLRNKEVIKLQKNITSEKDEDFFPLNIRETIDFYNDHGLMFNLSLNINLNNPNITNPYNNNLHSDLFNQINLINNDFYTLYNSKFNLQGELIVGKEYYKSILNTFKRNQKLKNLYNSGKGVKDIVKFIYDKLENDFEISDIKAKVETKPKSPRKHHSVKHLLSHKVSIKVLEDNLNIDFGSGSKISKESGTRLDKLVDIDENLENNSSNNNMCNKSNKAHKNHMIMIEGAESIANVNKLTDPSNKIDRETHIHIDHIANKGILSDQKLNKPNSNNNVLLPNTSNIFNFKINNSETICKNYNKNKVDINTNHINTNNHTNNPKFNSKEIYENELHKNYTYENLKILNSCDELINFNILNMHILDDCLDVFERVMLSENTNQTFNVERLVRNKTPTKWLHTANTIDFNLDLISFIKQYKIHCKYLKDKFIEKDFESMKKIDHVEFTNINGIINYMIYFSIKKKVPIPRIYFNGFFINNQKIIEKDHEGVFLRGLCLFNCHYDLHHNLLEEEKDKEFIQKLPPIFILAKEKNVETDNIKIKIYNESDYKAKAYNIDEEKIRANFFNKIKDTSRIKERNLDNVIKISKFFAKNLNINMDDNNNNNNTNNNIPQTQQTNNNSILGLGNIEI